MKIVSQIGMGIVNWDIHITVPWTIFYETSFCEGYDASEYD